MNPETPAKHKVGGDMYLFLGIKFRFLFDFIFRNFADSSIIEISRELIFAETARDSKISRIKKIEMHGY